MCTSAISHSEFCRCRLPLDPRFGVVVIVAGVVIVNWLIAIGIVSGVEIRHVLLVRLTPAVVDEGAPRTLDDHSSLLGIHWAGGVAKRLTGPHMTRFSAAPKFAGLSR